VDRVRGKGRDARDIQGTRDKFFVQRFIMNNGLFAMHKSQAIGGNGTRELKGCKEEVTLEKL
jgi:hypothetical protein